MDFTRLEHLNLAGCARLASLPELPRTLQYLELRGSDHLTRFVGQDIGPYDRGSDDRRNVAKTFHSRMKFGSELWASAHAKLLLLGDGRVGKSTLAKRLQWDGLTPRQRRDPTLAHLEPRRDEPFTHKVRFSRWETTIQLDASTADSLNQRAAEAGLRPPCDADRRVVGSVRIWDFGGQEIYHQTHRLFAAEGSVFLVVWKDEPVDDEALLSEKPTDVTDDEWRAWNRKRSLDYWLDYVQSIRADAKVILVCTHCPTGASRRPRTTRAERHKHDRHTCFYVDSLEAGCADNPEYRRLVDTIRSHYGAEATRVGILQPAFYAQASAYVDELLRENEESRRRVHRPTHLLLSHDDWSAALARRHRDAGSRVADLDSDDVASITGYLHDAGQIFSLRHRGQDAVLVDQDWATDLIYEMLHPGGPISGVIKANGGLFDHAALDDDRHWRSLRSDLEREQLLAYMQQCGIIVRLISREQHREEKDVYLATEKWLLPPYAGDVQRQVEREMQTVLDLPSGTAMKAFSFGNEPLSEFDFRALMVHLGGVLGTRATWFRNGLHAVDDRHEPRWCLHVKWCEQAPGSFLGSIKARLAAPREQLADLGRQVEAVFAGEGSPFAHRMHALRRATAEPTDVSVAYFRDIRDSDFDVAVSSSGKDGQVVEQLVGALKSDKLRVAWYRLDDCRSDENAKVMKFMLELRRPPCVLLCLSDDYLRDDPLNNWYCVWELADAILQIAKGTRTAAWTLVMYAEGQALSSKNLDAQAVRVLRSMEDYFLQKYAGVAAGDRDAFKYYLEWSNHFHEAAGGQAMAQFFRERGTLGTYSHAGKKADGSLDFAGVVADVRRALRGQG